MGKFDGYLICSDVDGTFHWGDTIAANGEAVRYFTENGGRFTFCTGRTVDYLLRPDLNELINAPACLFNGSVIYDYRAKKLLQKKHLPFSLGEFVDMVRPGLESVDRLYAYDNYTGEGLIFHDLTQIPAWALSIHPLKIICTGVTAQRADAFRDFCMELPVAQSSYISKSWSLGVEFNPTDGTKGHALDFIKSHLGNIHTAIGVGDYENDIPLLTHADIGIAVDNALPHVKAVADRLLCDATQCAIRELIGRLDTGAL